MIRHQITGARLRSRHFGGGSEIETSSHSALLATGGKKHMPNGQGLWRNEMIYISSQPFFMPLFLQMTASSSSSLSSRAELPVGIRRNGSGLYEDSESRDLPSPWSLLTSEWDFSTLQRSRGNEKKTGIAAVSIRSLSMKDGASAVWSFNHLKGTPSFFSQPLHIFHSPCILRQRRRHPLRLMNPGRRAALQSQICHFSSIKNEINFFTQHFELKTS